jgi:phosphopantetheinyl transferase
VDASLGVIWRTCPIRASPDAAARRWLTRDDLLHGARISHPQARTRSLVARSLLRRTIAEARPDLDPTVLAIRAAPSGRPTVVVVDPPPDPSRGADLGPTREDLGLSLAVSHTRGLAAVVVSTVGPVGIDVEPLGRHDLPPPAIWLTSEERADHDRLPPQDQRALLLRLWVAKEAALKAGDATLAPGRRELHVSSCGEVTRVPTAADGTEVRVVGRVGWREVDARYLVALASPVRTSCAVGVPGR